MRRSGSLSVCASQGDNARAGQCTDDRTRQEPTLSVSGQVPLTVYDVRGRRVRSLFDDYRSAGTRTAKWDGRDDRGHSVPQGVYFAVLRVAGEQRTQRLVVLR